MKKLIIPVLATLILLVGSVSAQQLWEYGSFNERADKSVEIGLVTDASFYTGSYEQNIKLLGYYENEMFGVALPKVVALFETSLQSSITASATSMTLVTGTDKEGSTLSGVYGFIIDEGSSDEEFIIGTVAGTAVTSITRGVSVADGETSVYSLIKAHRRGASVKITNAPLLMVLQRVANGDEGFPNTLFYVDGNQSIATSGDLASKKYVDDVGAGGFTSSNIATGYGLKEITSGAVGISLSATSSGLVGNLGVNNTELRIASSSSIWSDSADGQLKVATTSDFSFTGTFELPATTTKQFSAKGAIVPVGTLLMYTATSSPTGWLLADGTQVSRTDFAELYAVIGTTYGHGDGSTTFHLPNMTQRVPLGLDTDAADGIGVMLGETGGATSTNQTIDQMPIHTHTIDTSNNVGGSVKISMGDGGGSAYTQDTQSTGGGADLPTIDPYLTINYIIKY